MGTSNALIMDSAVQHPPAAQLPPKLPSISNLMSPPESKPLEHFHHHYPASPAKSTTSSSFPSSAHHAGTSPPASASDHPNLNLPLINMDKFHDPGPHSLQHPHGKTPEQQKLRVLPSPPVSPWQDGRLPQPNRTEQDAHHVPSMRRSSDLRDPILYGDSDMGSPLEEPLFPPEPAATTEELIDKHMVMHLTQFKNKLNQPSRDEYRLALACVPTIGSQYNRDPSAYMKRQREEQENEYWQAKRLCASPGTKAGMAASGIHLLSRSDAAHNTLAPLTGLRPAATGQKRSAKSALAPTSSNRRAVPANGAPGAVVKPKRIHKPSPITKLMNFPVKGRQASNTPDRALGGVSKREDTDFAALPDFAPPTATTLPPNQPRILKADWPSSNTLNLSNDPDRHLLAEAEVHLASTLRLNCATYLCSKRRIMEARVNALRIGKEFRKTDAQQACKIDVNKASKLWTAFDRVGWFEKSWFMQFLNK